MKVVYVLSIATGFLGLSSCEKCYECSKELPVTYEGQVIGNTPYTQTECGRGVVIKAKIEAFEEEGYICTKK